MKESKIINLPHSASSANGAFVADYQKQRFRCLRRYATDKQQKNHNSIISITNQQGSEAKIKNQTSKIKKNHSKYKCGYPGTGPYDNCFLS